MNQRNIQQQKDSPGLGEETPPVVVVKLFPWCSVTTVMTLRMKGTPQGLPELPGCYQGGNTTMSVLCIISPSFLDFVCLVNGVSAILISVEQQNLTHRTFRD